MEPVIKARGSGYKLEWDSGVEVYASRIIAKPDSLKCEVAILLNGHGLTRSSPTLTSESGKDGLIRKLKRRKPVDDWGIDWEIVVEEMAGLIIDRHRLGVSEVMLADVPEDDTLDWRVEGIMVEKDPTFLFGASGSGKSMFAIFLSVMIDQGYVSTDLGLKLKPGKVLYLDWETSESEIAKRTRQIHLGLNLEQPTGIVYQRCLQPLALDVDKVIDLVSKYDIDVIVCDSLGYATAGLLSKEEEVIPFFGALRAINKTALVISHTNKDDQFFGSNYINASSRMTWEAKGTNTPGSNGLDISCFNRKQNNVPPQSPMGWHIEFNDLTGVTFERRDVFETDSAGSMSVANIIFEILKREGPQSKDVLLDKIAAYKSQKPETVRHNFDSTLSRQKKAGLIEELGDNLKLVDKSASEEEEEGEWTM